MKEKEQQDDNLINSDTDSSCVMEDPSSELNNPLLDELSSALDGNIESHDNHMTTPPPVGVQFIQTEDGGYRVDESTITNSPIRKFTKLSDMATNDREVFKNQFNRPPPSKRRSNAVTIGGGTWGGSDFGELAHSSKCGTVESHYK